MVEQPPPDQPAIALQIEVPPEAEAGVYADFASMWFTGDTFVIDFVVTKGPVVPVPGEEGEQRGILPAKVVARVRIPPAQVFEIASKLTQTLTQWEERTGKRPPSGSDSDPLPPM